MAVYDIDHRETRTIIESGPFSASFWHCEMLLEIDSPTTLLDADRAREYAEFLNIAANELERFKAANVTGRDRASWERKIDMLLRTDQRRG